MQNKETIVKYCEINANEANNALNICVNIFEQNLATFTHKFPNTCAKNNIYAQTDNDDWTDGFWTGEIWLSYEATKKDRFKQIALIQVESFLNRINKRIVVDHHDMGFLYTPSCVPAYKMFKSEIAKEAALKAADNLLS